MARLLAWAVLVLGVMPVMAPLLASYGMYPEPNRAEASPVSAFEGSDVRGARVRDSTETDPFVALQPRMSTGNLSSVRSQGQVQVADQALSFSAVEEPLTVTMGVLADSTAFHASGKMVMRSAQGVELLGGPALDTSLDEGQLAGKWRIAGAPPSLLAGSLAAEPVPQDASGTETVALLMAASQQFLGALALAPYTTAHVPIISDLWTAFDSQSLAATGSPHTLDLPSMPGWLKQAMWVVTLTALGGIALRGFALFTRLDPEHALRHARRATLHDLIRLEPGLTFAELRRRTGLSHGTAQHHLRMLEGQDLVRSHPVGRQRKYFPQGPRAPPEELVPDGARRILELVIASRALTTAQVADQAGRKVQTVWPQLCRLRDHGLVVAERRGRRLSWLAATPA